MLEPAYVAGILDGEGHIACRLQPGSYMMPSLILVIVNSHEELIRELRSTFNCGSVFCTEPTGNYKRVWRWEVGGTHCTPILQAVFPFLMVKKRQAEYALAILEEMKRHEGKGRRSTREQLVRIELARRLNELNKTGRHDIVGQCELLPEGVR